MRLERGAKFLAAPKSIGGIRTLFYPQSRDIRCSMPRFSGAPNLTTLARTLGLSVTTVSRALKDGPEVTLATRERVKEAARAVGYYPNFHGQALKTGRTFSLAALLPLQTSAPMSDILRIPLIDGMTHAASAAGYLLSIVFTTAEQDSVESLARTTQTGSFDGVIVTRMQAVDRRIELLSRWGVPFVAFGRANVEAPYAYVDVDNFQIAFEATDFLIQRGHRRIAIQTMLVDDNSSVERLKGYGAALRKGGLSSDEALISRGNFTIADSETSFAALLDLPAPPTAVVCSSELGALGVQSALRWRGLSNNRVVEVVTRDTTEISDHLISPAAYHFVDMIDVGRRLVDMLIKRVEGAPPDHLREIVPGVFKVR